MQLFTFNFYMFFRRKIGEPGEPWFFFQDFRLKVFMPGLLDKEPSAGQGQLTHFFLDLLKLFIGGAHFPRASICFLWEGTPQANPRQGWSVKDGSIC